jgi:hypothetical protein
MAKIHQLKKNQKLSTQRVDNYSKASLPVFPRILNWLKIKKVQRTSFKYDDSWNAAYRIFTILRSFSEGVKKLDALIVNSTFQVATVEAEAATIDYSTWLNMLVDSEIAHGVNSYSFEFELLYNGAVIKGEHSEVCNTADNLVEIRKNDDISKSRRNSSVKTVLVEEYFFVYIRDIGLYGMVRAQHQEYMEKKELELENQIA